MDRSSPVIEFFIVLISWYNKNILSYRPSKTINLVYGSVPDQGTLDLSSSLYNTLHMGSNILSPVPSTFSNHLPTKMVDIAPYLLLLLIIDPSGAKSSIYVDY